MVPRYAHFWPRFARLTGYSHGVRTTKLFYHGRNRVLWWLTPHVLLNGLSARAMDLSGFLDSGLPFKELQARSDIRERALAAGDTASFSQQIRTHIDLPRP